MHEAFVLKEEKNLALFMKKLATRKRIAAVDKLDVKRDEPKAAAIFSFFLAPSCKIFKRIRFGINFGRHWRLGPEPITVRSLRVRGFIPRDSTKVGGGGLPGHTTYNDAK